VRGDGQVARIERCAQQFRFHRRDFCALAGRQQRRANTDVETGSRTERERAPPRHRCVAQQSGCASQFAPRLRHARARAVAQRRVGDAPLERGRVGAQREE